MRPTRSWSRALVLAALGALAFVPVLACTINPQPLPPGETPDSGFGGKGGTSVDATTGEPPSSTPDSGVLGPGDASAPASDATASDATAGNGDADARSDGGRDADASSDAGTGDAQYPDAPLAD